MNLSFYPRANGKSLTDKSIILDLDHTLVATQFGDKASFDSIIPDTPEYYSLHQRLYFFEREFEELRGDGKVGFSWGLMRPYAKDFLIFCFSYFKKVIVWSAGTRDYVESMVEILFSGIERPHFIFSREDCQLDADGLYRKPIAQLLELHPALSNVTDMKKIYILDDTSYTFEYNPQNAILIPRYLPAPEEDTYPSLNLMLENDLALRKLCFWFCQQEVMDSADVRLLKKEMIFKISIDQYIKRIKKFNFF